MAHKGHTVIGVDVNPAFVSALNQGRAPVHEPGLAEIIKANHERLSATQDYEAAELATEATFIIVPTPSGKPMRSPFRRLGPEFWGHFAGETSQLTHLSGLMVGYTGMVHAYRG